MSESCSGNCASCGESCGDRTAESLLVQANPKSNVKKVIAVMSGKGGVGKSTVSAMLAVAMMRKGYRTAILDADITGPSIPKAFGVTDPMGSTEDALYPARSEDGIEIMSINLLLENDTDPVVWRGPVVAGAVQQFWSDVVWEDIDFEEMTITINHNLTDIGGKHNLGSPKTESSRRVIGMSEVLASIFREQKAYIDKMSAALGKKFAHPEMVFTSALGNYRDRQSVYHSLKRFTKGTEFEDLTLHKLRHCNATLLLNSGVDLKVVSEHLGHSGVSVTADIYTDVLSSTKQKVADLVALNLE